MRLIAYSRVSTEKQAKDGHNVDLWPDKFKSYCLAYGYELVDIFIDKGVSRSTAFTKRECGIQVMGALSDDRADGILVPALDRIFGLTRDGLALVEDVLTPSGKSLVSINDHIDTSTPIGKMMFTMNLAMCQMEREKICQRTADTIAGLKANGQVYGHVPFGFVGIEGQLFQNPETFPIRQTIFNLRDAGLSYRALADELWRDKVAAPNGGKHWHTSTLKNILDSRHDFNHIPVLPNSVETPVSLVCAYSDSAAKVDVHA